MEELNASKRTSPGLKRAYSKPELMRVGLRPEEAVLGVCKNGPTVGGGAGGTCNTTSCQDTGS